MIEEHDERRRRLYEEFGAADIKQLKKGNVYLDYLETHSCITRLNQVYGLGWSFDVDFVSFDGTDVVVKGTLTTPDGIKSQFGAQRANKGMELGDCYKGAGSDALKKCASMLGVGLHLYRKDKKPGNMQYRPRKTYK